MAAAIETTIVRASSARAEWRRTTLKNVERTAERRQRAPSYWFSGCRVRVTRQTASSAKVGGPMSRVLGGSRTGMSKVRAIAIVPARNEKGAVGGVVSGDSRLRPWARRRRDRRRLDRPDGRARLPLPAPTWSRLPFNLGIGAAVQTGFKFALERGYELAVRLDGDGQHDPAELPKLLAVLDRDEADIVVGSRFQTAPATIVGRARGASASSSSPGSSRRSTRQRVTDTTSGFQALNRRGHRDLRRRLPARLSGGRGDGDGAQAPAAARRGARADARARARRVVDHGAAVDLLHVQGDARAARRHAPTLRRAVGGGGSRDPGSHLDRRVDRVRCS